MPHGTSLALLFAATHVFAPAGGGIGPLDVQVDLGGGVVVANGEMLPLRLDRGQAPAEQDVVVEVVPVGRGQRVVHVRVPVRDSGPGGPAWEALLAAGRREPIFSGMTGLAAGDSGERTGQAIQIVADGATSFVLVGDVREDLSICGQAVTLLDPRALYPGSLDLRPATVQRLSAEQRAAAQKIVAVERSGPLDAPLAKLLVARGSSVAGTRGAELTDGDARTAWREQRPGAGQGEFVVMAAPKGVPIARMEVAVPSSADGQAANAAPRTFYLVTSTRTFEVTLPSDGSRKPAASYTIEFPEPIEASCVALVLDAAYTRGLAHPEVGVAELVAYSEVDGPGATLDDAAKLLSSARGAAAAQVLERAGDAALTAVAKAYDGLDARGRALAIDVAASHDRCEDAAALLARGLCEGSGEAPRKAREKLERCKGAAPALAATLREDAASRACVAPLLATLAPGEAIDAIADAVAATGEGDSATRAALRGALALALSSAAPGRLATLIGDTRRNPTARLEMMRAAQHRVTEAPAESMALVDDLVRGAPPLRSRYLVLEPLSDLARGGVSPAVARLADAIAHDPDWPVRARAAEVAAGLPAVHPSLLTALGDPEPRVREAALGALATISAAEGVRPVAKLLARDGWSFVRARAAGVLMAAPASREADDALGDALGDPSTHVRSAAISALARRRAAKWRVAIRERLDEENEDPEVRATAAAALGALCDVAAADRLTELAGALGIPGNDADAQQVGLGALVGLAALHPANLRDRLAPLLAATAPPSVRAAAEQALTARAMCR